MLIPASNDIKIKAPKSNSDPNASTSDIPEYTVQLITKYRPLPIIKFLSHSIIKNKNSFFFKKTKTNLANIR